LDSTRVLAAHGEGDDPDRWGHLSAVEERKRGRRARLEEVDGPAQGNGPRRWPWARGERKRKGDGKGKWEWVGLKGDRVRERFLLFFNKRFKQFDSNLNSREFKLELNNKQQNNALRHECNTKEQPYLI
jgi:hypothetical protein